MSKTTKTVAPVVPPVQPVFKPALVSVPTVRERLARIERRALMAIAALKTLTDTSNEPRVMEAASRLIHEIQTEQFFLAESLPEAVLGSMSLTEEDRVFSERGEIVVYASENYLCEF